VNRHPAIFSIVAVVALAALAGASARAQVQGPPNALQGFSVNRDKPVKVQSDSLEVRDKEKLAIFSGNVHVIQGDTDMRCKTLHVFYEDTSAQAGQKASQSTLGGSNQIKRMEAKGGVVVTQKDQVVTGDTGEFDMRANTVTMNGNVVLTKGTDVLKGQRLVVNLTTGVSRVESGGGRVEMLMESKPRSDGKSSQPSSMFPTR
jgi:lipopolysaccharide export system protein LptA